MLVPEGTHQNGNIHVGYMIKKKYTGMVRVMGGFKNVTMADTPEQ
jgi:hypothetical protein